MNNKEKLVGVMSEYRLIETRLHAAQQEVLKQENNLHQSALKVVRTFHAVLGDRDGQGVIYRNERWRIVNGGIERTPFDLEVLE